MLACDTPALVKTGQDGLMVVRSADSDGLRRGKQQGTTIPPCARLPAPTEGPSVPPVSSRLREFTTETQGICASSSDRPYPDIGTSAVLDSAYCRVVFACESWCTRAGSLGNGATGDSRVSRSRAEPGSALRVEQDSNRTIFDWALRNWTTVEPINLHDLRIQTFSVEDHGRDPSRQCCGCTNCISETKVFLFATSNKTVTVHLENDKSFHALFGLLDHC